MVKKFKPGIISNQVPFDRKIINWFEYNQPILLPITTVDEEKNK